MLKTIEPFGAYEVTKEFTKKYIRHTYKIRTKTQRQIDSQIIKIYQNVFSVLNLIM